MTVVHYPRCLCSQAMEKLLTWRNPHGDEVNWYSGNLDDDDNGIPYDTSNFLFRKVTTELALPLLALASLIESVAWFALGLAILYTPVPRKYTEQMWKFGGSSVFTLSWSIAGLFNNFLYTNLSTKEAFASIHFTGGERADSLYREVWIDTHYKERRIRNGTSLLLEEVIKPNSQDMLFMEDFADYARELYPYILLKSFSRYITCGNDYGLFKRIFKSSTMDKLKLIKQKYENNANQHQDFLDKISTWKNFESAINQVQKCDSLLNDLLGVYTNELKDGANGFLYISDCWKEALKSPLFLQPEQ